MRPLPGWMRPSSGWPRPTCRRRSHPYWNRITCRLSKRSWTWPCPGIENGVSAPMAIDIVVPPLSQTSDTLVLTAWLKKVGDRVSKGEALFEVETDKATLEVESP